MHCLTLLTVTVCWQVGNWNVHPPRVQFCAYRPACKFTSGSTEGKRNAKRAVSAAMIRHLAEELGKYSSVGMPAAACLCRACQRMAATWLAAHTCMLMQPAPGTLIHWPWGGRGLQRDGMGRIRVVPRLVAVPVDGPEAMHLTGVR